MNPFYVITRGVKPGKSLTTAQRSSSKFSEEPVVLGRVLRSRSLPMKVSVEQFALNRVELERLARAGAIRIQFPQELTSTPKDVEAASDQETQMGTPSSKFGGTPTVHPAEAGVTPEVPIETAPTVVETAQETAVTPSVETAPVATEAAPKVDEIPPAEAKADFRNKKGQRK